ncbi:hypothetical protein TRAPUB_12636 [Trametes pubescens]|uniref:C2H2-type domain-containing protein n=1 Tax=Trametes pubescens TaxID=154538 RepID=A0A1M2VTL3_TRAPU|nr:hypothetical protein TRAPUB_12636 [Trametes pubescens]
MNYSTFTFEYPLERSALVTHPTNDLQLGCTLEATPGQPLDYAFMRQLAHHERTLQEVTNQWPFPIPWCDSIGIDTQDILGPAPIAPFYDEEELPIPQRPEGQDVASNDRDAAFAIEHSQVAAPAPAPPAPVSASPARKSAPPEKASVKRPRPATSKPALHRTVKTIPSHKPTLDLGDPRNVRCEWGRCDKILWRLMWQAHMDEEHKLRHQGYKTASWHCQWRGCKHIEKTHELMEAHLRERHFVRDVPFCDLCGKVFVGLEWLKKHVAAKHS